MQSWRTIPTHVHEICWKEDPKNWQSLLCEVFSALMKQCRKKRKKLKINFAVGNRRKFFLHLEHRRQLRLLNLQSEQISSHRTSNFSLSAKSVGAISVSVLFPANFLNVTRIKTLLVWFISWMHEVTRSRKVFSFPAVHAKLRVGRGAANSGDRLLFNFGLSVEDRALEAGSFCD